MNQLEKQKKRLFAICIFLILFCFNCNDCGPSMVGPGVGNTITVDLDGNPHISYLELQSCNDAIGCRDSLKYAFFENDSWNIEIIEEDQLQAYTAIVNEIDANFITIDQDRTPHIVYAFCDPDVEYVYECSYKIKHLYKNDETWQAEIVGGGFPTKLVVSDSGNLVILSETSFFEKAGNEWYEETKEEIISSIKEQIELQECDDYQYLDSYADSLIVGFLYGCVINDQDGYGSFLHARKALNGGGWTGEEIASYRNFEQYHWEWVKNEDGIGFISLDWEEGLFRFIETVGDIWAIDTYSFLESGFSDYKSSILDSYQEESEIVHFLFSNGVWEKGNLQLYLGKREHSDWTIMPAGEEKIQVYSVLLSQGASMDMDTSGDIHVSYFFDRDSSSEDSRFVLGYLKFNGYSWEMNKVDE